jgi:hypothetical protein
MKIIRTTAAAAAVLALAVTPALAKGGPAPSPTHAYGKFCQNQSKKHVDGQKGTPFSQCVTALAHAAKDSSLTGKEACKSMSKKHVAGQKGTPFSKCVVGVAQMRKSQSQSSAGSTS